MGRDVSPRIPLGMPATLLHGPPSKCPVQPCSTTYLGGQPEPLLLHPQSLQPHLQEVLQETAKHPHWQETTKLLGSCSRECHWATCCLQCLTRWDIYLLGTEDMGTHCFCMSQGQAALRRHSTGPFSWVRQEPSLPASGTRRGCTPPLPHPPCSPLVPHPSFQLLDNKAKSSLSWGIGLEKKGLQGAKHARGDIPIACKDLGFLVCLMGMHTLETTRIFSYGIFAPLAEFINSINKPCMCVIFSVEI